MNGRNEWLCRAQTVETDGTAVPTDTVPLVSTKVASDSSLRN